MPQTIRQKRAFRAFAANDPRVVRVSNHRDPQWIEGPEYNPERAFVGPVLLAIAVGLIVVLALGPRYGVDLLAGVL